MIIIGLVAFIIMLAPFLLIKQPAARLTRISFFIVLLFLLPVIFPHMPFFSNGDKPIVLGAVFSYTECFSLATVALLPLALKSIVLLRKHEIRMFNFVLNITMFLFVALIQPLAQVIAFFNKLILHIFASF